MTRTDQSSIGRPAQFTDVSLGSNRSRTIDFIPQTTAKRTMITGGYKILLTIVSGLLALKISP